ncbi:unnamed protein product [Zymoseptoria tritici ST99CH_1A5]|uniref:Uncharacterized protein n=2 Tax=Zymoseptoria tritici TaxID=1047171 RepID=A0A2H1H8Z1_ZYMTR|nr:unnamed protein product [Zymoseptoria tritici ST99CH_1E4]SMY30056.1 unnamed protein product [Zymoseptoria tritici ST99CH_1A5]
MERMNSLCQLLKLQTPHIKTKQHVQHQATTVLRPELYQDLPISIRQELEQRIQTGRNSTCAIAAKNKIAEDINVALEYLLEEKKKSRQKEEEQGRREREMLLADALKSPTQRGTRDRSAQHPPGGRTGRTGRVSKRRRRADGSIPQHFGQSPTSNISSTGSGSSFQPGSPMQSDQPDHEHSRLTLHFDQLQIEDPSEEDDGLVQ